MISRKKSSAHNMSKKGNSDMHIQKQMTTNR